jgi:hypothetical protein
MNTGLRVGGVCVAAILSVASCDEASSLDSATESSIKHVVILALNLEFSIGAPPPNTVQLLLASRPQENQRSHRA